MFCQKLKLTGPTWKRRSWMQPKYQMWLLFSFKHQHLWLQFVSPLILERKYSDKNWYFGSLHFPKHIHSRRNLRYSITHFLSVDNINKIRRQKINLNDVTLLTKSHNYKWLHEWENLPVISECQHLNVSACGNGSDLTHHNVLKASEISLATHIFSQTGSELHLSPPARCVFTPEITSQEQKYHQFAHRT